jgi:hypothetical protein
MLGLKLSVNRGTFQQSMRRTMRRMHEEAYEASKLIMLSNSGQLWFYDFNSCFIHSRFVNRHMLQSC